MYRNAFWVALKSRRPLTTELIITGGLEKRSQEGNADGMSKQRYLWNNVHQWPHVACECIPLQSSAAPRWPPVGPSGVWWATHGHWLCLSSASPGERCLGHSVVVQASKDLASLGDHLCCSHWAAQPTALACPATETHQHKWCSC